MNLSVANIFILRQNNLRLVSKLIFESHKNISYSNQINDAILPVCLSRLKEKKFSRSK